jgi:hypothetical protein
MQWPARRLQIFGIHYHVGVRSAEKSIAIANALQFYLAHLLALSASSPYWEGHDTGLASCRVQVFEGLPTAGLPPVIENWADFEQFMHTLVAAEAIKTIREVWWDVRPHPNFGTVELRICDAMPTLREVAAVGALVQCLVHRLDTRLDAGELLYIPREWTIRQNKWLRRRPRCQAHRRRRGRMTKRRGGGPHRDAEADRRRARMLGRARRRRLDPAARAEHGPPARSWRGRSAPRCSALIDELATDVRATSRPTARSAFLDAHLQELIALAASSTPPGRREHGRRRVAERLRIAGLAPQILERYRTHLRRSEQWSSDPGQRRPRADLDALAMDDETTVPPVPGPRSRACVRS